MAPAGSPIRIIDEQPGKVLLIILFFPSKIIIIMGTFVELSSLVNLAPQPANTPTGMHSYNLHFRLDSSKSLPRLRRGGMPSHNRITGKSRL